MGHFYLHLPERSQKLQELTPCQTSTPITWLLLLINLSAHHYSEGNITQVFTLRSQTKKAPKEIKKFHATASGAR